MSSSSKDTFMKSGRKFSMKTGLEMVKLVFFRSSAQRFIVPQQLRQAKLSGDNNKNKSVSQKRSHPSSKKQRMEVSATNSSAFYKVQSHADGSTQQQLETNSSATGIPQRKTSSATHIDMASMLAASQLENTNSLSRRLTSSTEGRFTIIDEHYKESTDESFDDSDDEGSQSFDAHTPDNLRLTKSSSGYCISCTPSPFVKKLSVVSSSPNIKQMASHGINCVGSRFKIVPVESRYKRGRWQAWDYYLDENGHYSHTNTHAPVVEDGQFRSAAVHLTGDSFLAPSRNSIPNQQTSAVSQPNPLPPKPLNPPKIAVVPPTPLPITSSFALTTSSSATTVPVNPFSFGGGSGEKPSDTSVVSTPLDVPSLSTVPSKSLTDLSPTSDAPKQHLINGILSGAANEDQRVPISSSTSSSPLSIIASPSATLGNSQLNSAEYAAINSLAFSSPKRIIATSSPVNNNGDNSAASSQSYPSPSSSLLMPANLMIPSSLGSPGSRQQQQMASSNGRPLTPSAEMLLNQYGLERSLSATSSYNDSSLLDLNATMQQAVDERQLTHDHFNNNNSSSINGNNAVASQNAQLVAIDSKIEQAMDLVKTHLIFAVREEVELLRSKILELETTVIQLEAENSILREHVPAEILQNLTLQPGANTVSSSAMMTAQ